MTILSPPSPLPARLEEPERLPFQVPIDVRGTARLLALPFRKLPRFIMAAFPLPIPSFSADFHQSALQAHSYQQVNLTTFIRGSQIVLLRTWHT